MLGNVLFSLWIQSRELICTQAKRPHVDSYNGFTASVSTVPVELIITNSLADEYYFGMAVRISNLYQTNVDTFKYGNTVYVFY